MSVTVWAETPVGIAFGFSRDALPGIPARVGRYGRPHREGSPDPRNLAAPCTCGGNLAAARKDEPAAPLSNPSIPLRRRPQLDLGVAVTVAAPVDAAPVVVVDVHLLEATGAELARLEQPHQLLVVVVLARVVHASSPVPSLTSRRPPSPPRPAASAAGTASP